MIKGKNTIRVGGNVVERYREPPNRHCANNMTQYIFDYKNFKTLTPDNRPGALIEASTGPRKRKANNAQSINPSTNRSASYGAICGVDLGGSPDMPGRF
jgi:hypothetical protein